MVYLVHQLWSAAEGRRENNKVSLDDGYRLHVLVPGGHTGYLIESPILHIEHQARLIPYSKICMWNQNGDSISSGFRDATIFNFFQNPSWPAAAIIFIILKNVTIHATFTTSCHINYTGLMPCRWNQKRSFYLKLFPRYDNFSKSNMAAVAMLDF